MKILKFNLLAVGPFTGAALDLSGGQHGLHVILGPNEAGKSSALRALRALLYGFPGQTSDNFVHGYPELRVGATLRHSDGTELTVVRRKRKSDTLLGADEKPIDETVLGRFLGTVDEQQFTTFFGIGHADLREGGEQILRGGGKVGESLFAAGAGGLRLRKLKETIEERADAIYKPKGRNAKIPVALAEFRGAIEKVRDLSLSVEEWSQHDVELTKAKKDVADVRQQSDALTAAQNRLQRLGRAIPLLARRRALMEKITAIGVVPALSDDFSETRRTAARSLKEADEAAEKLAKQIADLTGVIDQLRIPDDLLQQSQAVETLYGQVHSYQEARRQVPALRVRRDESKHDAERILRGLRPDVAIENVEILRLGTARREQIQVLSRDAEAFRQSLKLSRKALGEFEEEKHQGETELSQLPAGRDAGALQSLVAATRKEGALEKALAEEGASLKLLDRRAEADLKKLGLWTGSIEEMETLAVPSIESIEQGRTRQETIGAKHDKAVEDVRKLEEELAGFDHGLEVLRAGGEIPTETELQQARERRQEGWALVRQAWLGGAAPADEVARFTAGAALPEAYEASVAHADAVADALRSESDRVAQQANLVQQRKAGDDKLRRHRQHAAETNASMKQSIADWKTLWSAIGIEPLSPREMSAWATRQRELAQAARSIREKSEQFAERGRQIAAHRGTLIAALQQLNETVRDDGSLATVLTQAEKIIEQIRIEAVQRATIQTSIKKLGGKINTAREKLATAEEELAAWRDRWEEAVVGLGVPAGAEPAVALAVVKQIDELFLKIESAQKTDGEIAQRQTEIDSFEPKAAELAARLAPDWLTQPSDQAVMELYKRLKQARDDYKLREGRVVQRQQYIDNLETTRRRGQAARETQAALLLAAGCETIEQLPAVETAHQELRQCTADKAQVERELLLLSNGETIDELAEQARALDADALPAQLDELKQQINALQERRTALDQTIGAEGEVLRQMDGNASASEAAERAQELLADLRESTETYARLNLAGAILTRGIERYRQRKQGPLLTRASELFAALTLGSFIGLQTDYDEKDQPVLVGLRGGRKQVDVAGMSDGTRDQLYLALRLATLDDYLSRSEPIPFVVDDILVNFDDGRAMATLKILADLAKKTQVILFTHHAHIAELAARNVEGVYRSALESSAVAMPNPSEENYHVLRPPL